MNTISMLPLPGQIKRVMLFIDGKNLAGRFSEMSTRSDLQPKKGIEQIKDTFVWIPLTNKTLQYPLHAHGTRHGYDIVRAYYYTYFTDDDIKGLERKIKSMPIQQPANNTLTPVVFKKLSRQARAKGDDIALAVEALHNSYNHNLDIAHIFTGDGDYIPLIKEIKHLGITVYVSAFSAGLNEDLQLLADKFTSLDEEFFDKGV